MSALHTFLESNQWNDEKLGAVFWEQFGVKVNSQGNIYQFKYDDRAAKHHLEVTRECRGAILLQENERWVYLGRPFDKFFNITEGNCPLFNKKKLSEFGENLELIEKADGSLLILWWNSVEQKWAISTTGSLKTQKPPKKGGELSTETFEEIFYRVSKLKDAALAQLEKGHSYLFELCSSENPIITKYGQEKVFLLGIRNNESGAYLNLENPLTTVLLASEGICLPEKIALKDLALETKEDLLLLIEKESRQKKYGKWPEGFVLFRNQEPIAKLKNRTYLQCFYTLGGNTELAKKGIMESVITGSIDDIYGHLDEDLKMYADKLKIRAEEKVKATFAFILHIAGKDQLSPKEFALELKEKVPASFHNFFFQNRQTLLKGEGNGQQMFEDWLQINAEKIQI